MTKSSLSVRKNLSVSAFPLGLLHVVNICLIFKSEQVFGAIALISACVGLLLQRYMPNCDRVIESDHDAPLRTYVSRSLLKLYGVTIFGFGGGFVFFSYIEPYLRSVLPLGSADIARSLTVVGVGSLFGNILGGKVLSAFGLARGLIGTIALQALVLIAIPLTKELPAIFHILLFFWSMACFSVAPIVQYAAVQLGSDNKGLNPRITAGLNATAFNIGISGASFCASRLVGIIDVSYLPFASAIAVSVALPLCMHVESQANRRY